jgi:ribonuclease HI
VSDIITIYTDGCSLGNPGPGGWAAVLISGDNRKELYGGFRLTTNNRMEILAAVEALKALKSKRKAVIHTDSRLLVDAVNKNWLGGWQRKGWKKSSGEKVLNPDLWQELVKLLEKRDVEFKWVKGHAGIEENERCDELSKAAAAMAGLPPDKGYEMPGETKNNNLPEAAYLKESGEVLIKTDASSVIVPAEHLPGLINELTKLSEKL